MFELIERDPRAGHRKLTTVIISIVVHVVVVGALIIVPLLYVTDQLPTPNEVITAFAAPAPAPPPPPPPPPPSAAPPPRPVATTGQQSLAPVESPPTIEVPPVETPAPSSQGVSGGVPGGIAGGVPGGVVGGIPEAPGGTGQTPVRVGGQIKAPDLVHRVDPRYPTIAQSAHVSGVVVLEATVDPSGRVQSVHMVRGIPLLNEAALEAVKQWRYSPLMLNGRATPFILTVTVTFALQ